MFGLEGKVQTQNETQLLPFCRISQMDICWSKMKVYLGLPDPIGDFRF
jgi:hypothetical protein